MKKLVLVVCAVMFAVVVVGNVHATSPYATTLQSSSGFSGGWYGDPNDILGPPTTSVYDSWANDTIKVSMVYAAWGDNAITTFNSGQVAVVKFDHSVTDNANGPDFIVFGNAFYAGSGWVDADTDMDQYKVTGGAFSEAVTVHVSADNSTWYTFSNGPYGDTEYPTQAYDWNSSTNDWGNALDFTEPVPDDVDSSDFVGETVDTIIDDYYQGSGGGTAFDLADLSNGPSSIQYVKFTGTGGEIDAVSDID